MFCAGLIVGRCQFAQWDIRVCPLCECGLAQPSSSIALAWADAWTQRPIDQTKQHTSHMHFFPEKLLKLLICLRFFRPCVVNSEFSPLQSPPKPPAPPAASPHQFSPSEPSDGFESVAEFFRKIRINHSHQIECMVNISSKKHTYEIGMVNASI